MAGKGKTFFHSCEADVDLQRLLDPAEQVTEPWGGPDHGPCDKCGGEGATLYECSSCMEAGVDSTCPACRGRVCFRETCPACLGDGRIDHTIRHGIAAFPAREGLYRYLAVSQMRRPRGKPWSSWKGRSARSAPSMRMPAPCSSAQSGSSR